jgi:hypothetical protein
MLCVVARTAVFLFGLLTVIAFPALAQIIKPAPLYYCPDKLPDQQIAARPTPGCLPLVDPVTEEAKPRIEESAQSTTRNKRPIRQERALPRLEHLEQAISTFLNDYRTFLGCCLTTPEALATVEDLEDRASSLLQVIQEAGLVNMQTNWRGITLSQLIPPVAQAKLDLRTLRAKLEALERAKGKLDELDEETAARERRRIQLEEETLGQQVRLPLVLESARTGLGIGDTSVPARFGEAIADTTLKPTTGIPIGSGLGPRSDQASSLHLRMGLETHDSALAPRHGPENQNSTLPYSFGFEIGIQQNPSGSSTTPSRVGPAIGDSTLNRPP